MTCHDALVGSDHCGEAGAYAQDAWINSVAITGSAALHSAKGYPPPEAGVDPASSLVARKHSLQDAAREKGKFRTFLLSAVTHFLANEHDKSQRLKRGGGFTFLPLETAHAEELFNQEQWNTISPETAFDRSWAARMSEVVLARLRAEFQGHEQQIRFAELKPFLLGEPGADAYVAVAARLQISEQGVKSAVHRLRQRFVALFREEISQTVATRAEIDEELRYLVRLMTS